MKYLLILFLIFSLPASSQILKGKIVEIVEADVLIFQDKDNYEYIVKLEGIDSPREGHPYWERAINFTQRKCEGKDALVKVISIDSTETIYATVYVNGKNINEALLIEGFAWFNEYNSSEYWVKLENNARNANLNIWTLEYPMGQKYEQPRYVTSEGKLYSYICSQNPALYHRHKDCRILNSCSSEILEINRLPTHNLVPCSLCSTPRKHFRITSNN